MNPWARWLTGVLVGGLLGAGAGALGVRPARRVDAPAPWTVPRIAGGTSLRLAMVHDVLHERYPRHGKAWYEHTVAKVEQALAGRDLEGSASLDDLALFDDWSAALDYLHRPEEAAAVQRRKLALLERRFPDALRPPPPAFYLAQDWATLEPRARQARALALFNQPKPEGEALAAYRTWANLGTHLIHASYAAAQAGDPQARARLEEGAAWIDRAVGLYPGAHFGREEWQAACLLTVKERLEDPARARGWDLIGNDLSRIEGLADTGWRPHSGRVSPGDAARAWEPLAGALEAWQRGETSQEAREAAAAYRSYTPTVPAELWDPRPAPPPDAPTPAQPAPFRPAVTARYPGGVPFDEPTLGILGMWMLGGGPNPHFALSLGLIMEQVRQRFLAWSAYARVRELTGDDASRFPEVDLARARQVELAKALGEDQATLQAEFERGLAEGRRWQAAYQAWEAEQLAAGVDPDAPDFYAGFFAREGDVATPTGDADVYSIRLDPQHDPRRSLLPTALFGAGLIGLLSALSVPRR